MLDGGRLEPHGWVHVHLVLAGCCLVTLAKSTVLLVSQDSSGMSSISVKAGGGSSLSMAIWERKLDRCSVEKEHPFIRGVPLGALAGQGNGDVPALRDEPRMIA